VGPNHRISVMLEELALLLELLGENHHKVRAHARAARSVRRLSEDVAELVGEGRLTRLPGIGEAIAGKIEEYVRDGRMSALDQARERIPQGLFDLARLSGLGVARLRTLWQADITDLDALEQACAERRVRAFSGFGARLEERLAVRIREERRYQGRVLLVEGEEIADELTAELIATFPGTGVQVAGEIRRASETAGRVELVLSTDEVDRVLRSFDEAGLLVDVDPDQGRVVFVRARTSAHIHVVPRSEAARALLRASGAPDFVAEVEARLVERGRAGEVFETEAQLFAAAGMPFVPPSLRECAEQARRFAAEGLPPLVENEQVRAVLHVHSDHSDGVDGLEELVRAAKVGGFTTLGISDHSASAYYANGLSRDRILRQRDEIERLRVSYSGLLILQGIESDILPDGELDYPDPVLEELDFVIGSVHSGFGMTEKAMTRRVCAALAHPRLSILGHPTGRLLLSRVPYQVDVEAIIEAAAGAGKALEINASPARMDLGWRHQRTAVERGALLAIGVDAHRAQALSDVRLGTALAQKGEVPPERLVNTWPPDRLAAWLRTPGPVL
jgi:DNA polymerase (family X)